MNYSKIYICYYHFENHYDIRFPYCKHYKPNAYHKNTIHFDKNIICITTQIIQQYKTL